MFPGQPTPPSARLTYLDNFRGLAITMVVATHALGYAHLPEDEQRRIAWIVQTIAVPVFFLVDGLLFSLRQGAGIGFDYRGYVAKSAHRLLVPWALFTFLYWVLRLIFELVGSAPAHILVGRPWQDWVSAIYLSEFSSQMYFLPSLFFIRAAAQPLRAFAQSSLSTRTVILILYVGAFHLLPIRGWFYPGLDPIYHALWGLQFYLIGLMIPLVAGLFTSHSLAVSLATLSGGILLPAYSEHMAVPSQFLLLIGSYSAFASITAPLRLLAMLGRYTMGIYLLHIPLVMKGMASVLSRVLPSTSLTFFACLTLSSLTISLLLTKLLLLFPHGYRLFGEQPQADDPKNRTR